MDADLTDILNAEFADILVDDYPENETFVNEFTTTQPEREPRAKFEGQNQTGKLWCLS